MTLCLTFLCFVDDLTLRGRNVLLAFGALFDMNDREADSFLFGLLYLVW
jgi:hypothetical protein